MFVKDENQGCDMKPQYQFVIALSVAIAAMMSRFAFAQGGADYPTKPVRVVVAQATGGGTDIQARLFSAKLSENLRRQFIVDNRTGAGNTIGFEFVAKAAPDGYTLLAVTPSFTFSPALYKKLSYDPIKDFAPISIVTKAPYILVVHPSLPVKSVKELIALARPRPGQLNSGVGGSGSFTHLAMVWFADSAKIKLTYIPYKGTGPVLIDLIAGQIDMTIGNVLSTLPFIKAGKMRALASSMSTRSAVLPNLPTIAEAGIAGYDLNTWHGWAAPAGTPQAVINKVHQELVRMVKSPQVAEQLAQDGGEPVGSTPEEFRQLLLAEVIRWRKLIASSSITVEQ